MSRSLKKGPIIDFKLEKREQEMQASEKKSVLKKGPRR